MKSNENIQNLREDYRRSTLEMSETDKSPFRQFDKWFREALQAEIPEPNAMTVATVAADGKPSARVVLLKGVDERGFVFYTNYESQKGRELDENPAVALVFNWLGLERQIRIEGTAEKISEAESEAYFQKRPKKSQIGAWASPQSRPIRGRDILNENTAALQEKYADSENLPRPPHWGGFRVKAERIEFWQGRSSRLHDRINYIKTAEGKWMRERLAP